MNADKWENHYTRNKSFLVYPDENLVRMLNLFIRTKKSKIITAVDLGCGSGRHIKYLKENGIDFVIGLDYSINALQISMERYAPPVVLANNIAIPLMNDSVDIVVSWGSLHYSSKDKLNIMLKEIHRIIKVGGRLFGTLRSSRDSFLKKGKHIGNDTWITDLNDLDNSVVSFYNETELNTHLSIFPKKEYGLMERSLLGDIDSVISHWFFWVEK